MIFRKLREIDLEKTILFILYSKGSMCTTSLREEIIDLLDPQGENLDPLENRPDTKITQIVRNVNSHRNTYAKNVIYKGLVNYDDQTGILSITEAGKQEINDFIASKIIEDIR